MSDAPFTSWFAALLGTLLQGFSSAVARNRRLHPVAAIALARVQRTLGRLTTLLALFRAGRLPNARARRSSARASTVEPTTAEAPAERTAALPRGRGWLLGLTAQHGAYGGTLLRRVVAEPEMQDLLAASPQAVRLLRPLWRMLCPDPLPAALRLPPRPPRPRRRAVALAPPGEVPLASCRGARLDARLRRVLGSEPVPEPSQKRA